MNVLFVCTGNTCRSPMAQAIYQSITGEEARSGGLGVNEALPVNPLALAALESLGITGFTHMSRQVTPEDMAWADKIYVMTQLHRSILAAVCPDAADRILLLGGDRDISDPFGGDLEVYTACCREIEQCIRERCL